MLHQQPIVPAITVGQYSAAGRKSRNDDSYGVVVPEGAELAGRGIAMAIADGMSSSEGAKAASETSVKSFLEDYYATPDSWTVKKSAAVVLKALNNWLHAQGLYRHGSASGMVSTFSALILKAGMAHVFHAGDTRVTLMRNDACEPLTRDHRVSAGREKGYLSRALGINPDLEIDYRTETIEAGDVLIFTTDGVHEFMSAAQMANIIRQSSGDLVGAAQAICELALKKGSDDNVTCQIVRVDDPGRPDAASHLQSLTALPFPPELAPGMTFEGLRIVRELHTSKRTQVYLAERLDSREKVVIKTPSVNFEDDPTYIEMFSREEWIGRLVQSPYVLKVLQPAAPRRSLYYLTEYFEGQTLRQWMLDNPRPDLETVRAIVEQIAKGLRAFHRKDVVHQDLKPENIMIDRLGTVRIIDFGSSRAASQLEAGSPAVDPGLVGTIDYTAPEYHLGEHGTNRSDIYSLGVIAYEVLTGRLPYAKGFASAREINKRSYVSATSLRKDVPVWMDAALAKAVAKRPSERTDALSALVEDLKRPNAALDYDRPRPLLERDPLAFWKGLSAALAILVVVLLALLSRG
jgi:serine/threonine protein phosphatase PrpC